MEDIHEVTHSSWFGTSYIKINVDKIVFDLVKKMHRILMEFQIFIFSSFRIFKEIDVLSQIELTWIRTPN